jgi:hypothetical protein
VERQELDLSPETWYGMPPTQQGRQGRLLLPERGEVQGPVRDLRLQRQREPRPTSFALKELTASEEAKISALVKKAVS